MAKEIINLNYWVEVAPAPIIYPLRNTIMIHNLECFLFIFFCLGYLKSCLHFKGYENSNLCWAEVYIIIYPKRRGTILLLQTIGGSDLEPIAIVVGSIQEHIIVNNNLHQNNASIQPNQVQPKSRLLPLRLSCSPLPAIPLVFNCKAIFHPCLLAQKLNQGMINQCHFTKALIL